MLLGQLPLALILACSPGVALLGGTSDSEEPTSVDPVSTESVGGVEEEEPVDLGEDFAWVFDDTVVHHIEISLNDAARMSLWGDPYTWVEGTVTVDGYPEMTVGVRLRGKIGAFRELDEKPKWKIDFNRYVSGQTFFGLETLALNNSVVDCSYVKEMLAYVIFDAAGVPSSRMAFATVSLDGEDYGLNQMFEFTDDVFLKDRYGKPTGNLYDGKYIYGGGWDYTFIDFTPDLQDGFQLEEGEDVGLEDIYAITATLFDNRGTAEFTENTGELINWEAVHRFLASEHWTGQWDGYTLDRNNYRVYFDVDDGRMEFLTTDLDYAFYGSSSWFSWDDPAGELVEVCYMDPNCTNAQAAAVDALLDQLAPIDLQQKLVDWYSLVDELILQDPRGECSDSAVSRAKADIFEWVEVRDQELRDFWGL